MIDIELVNPYFDATAEFLFSETGAHATKGTVCESSTQGTTQEVNILIGVTGAVNGQVIYSMSLATAKAIAGSMLMKEADGLDRTVQSALCELGNMVSGMSISKYPGHFSDVALTPPSLVIGKDIYISVLKIGCYYMSIISEFGTVDVTVALEKRLVRQDSPAQPVNAQYPQATQYNHSAQRPQAGQATDQATMDRMLQEVQGQPQHEQPLDQSALDRMLNSENAPQESGAMDQAALDRMLQAAQQPDEEREPSKPEPPEAQAV